MDTIGKRIRYARKMNNLSLSDVKDKTGLSTGNLSELENDKFAPSTNALISFRKVFNVSIDWILTGEKNENILNKVSLEEDEKPYFSNLKPLNSDLSAEEIELLDAYRKLDAEKKRDIQGYVRVANHSKTYDTEKKNRR